MLPRRHSGIPAYLIQDQLTGGSAIARTPFTVASNSPKVGSFYLSADCGFLLPMLYLGTNCQSFFSL